MANSTLQQKPTKPRPDFPLFPHATGRWAKKVRGKFEYFGKVADDPKGEAALKRWLDEKEDLLAGRKPRAVPSDGLTVRDLCNHFMAAKEHQRDAGDITTRSFADYFATCKFVVDSFGKNRLADDLASDDFQSLRTRLAKLYGVHRLGEMVQHVRTVFKFGFEAGLLDKPMRFGPTFKRPAKRIMRAHRQKNGERMFEAKELRALYYAAEQPLKAMILLGINCGFGNHDCGTLKVRDVDLDNGWISHPRPKTAVERRCPLWAETIEAIRESLANRPKAKERKHDGLLFVTKHGAPWAKDTADNPVTKEFRKLLDDLGLHRPGLGFYALRHTFETVAGGSRDQVAVNAVMGHVDVSMAAEYRERIDDGRLQDVVNHVHGWLFPRPTTA